jgi:ribosome maturation factor RimP
MTNSISRTGFALLAGTLVAITTGLSAHAADQVRVRGTVESLDGSTLSVKTREGTEAKIMLKEGWKVSSVAKASMDDIKPGDFVGIASLPTADGGDGALEVLIFPAALKGTGEGSYSWDLKPNSSMTNATVADAVKSVNGRTVTVTYKGKEKKIAIPDGTPVVTFASAEVSDLKSGATVFIPSEKAADGSMSTSRVVVGTNGVVPPM